MAGVEHALSVFVLVLLGLQQVVRFGNFVARSARVYREDA